MKKLILSITTILIIGVSSLSANTDTINTVKAREVFKKEFPNAESAKWSKEGGYTKVSFLLYGKGAFALFTPEGDLMGTVRNMFYAETPINVITSFEKRFKNPKVYSIVEINCEKGISYRLLFDNEQKRYEATINNDGTLGKVHRIK